MDSTILIYPMLTVCLSVCSVMVLGQSRAIKLDGLRVLRFDARKFRVHPSVNTFYDDKIKGRSPREEGEEKDWNIHLNWTEAMRHIDPDTYRAMMRDMSGGPPMHQPNERRWLSKPPVKRPNPYDSWYNKSKKY